MAIDRKVVDRRLDYDRSTGINLSMVTLSTTQIEKPKLKPRFTPMLTAAVCLMASGTVAFGQSIDGNAPTPLSSANEIQGETEANGKSYYYSFVGGPGLVTVTASGATDYYSSLMNVRFLDERGAELANLPVNANDTGARVQGKVQLARRQLVKVQVMFGDNQGVHVNFKVALGGAVSLQNATAVANTSPASNSPGSIVPFTNDDSAGDIDGAVAGSVDGTADGYAGASREVASAAANKGSPKVAVGIPGQMKPPVPVTPAQITRPGTQVTKPAPQLKKPTSQVSDLTPASSDDDDAINSPIEDKWALIVGVSKFQKPEINLKYPSKDARDLYAYLVNEGNFARDHVKLIVDENATKERVLEEIGDKWLPRLARPNDLVVIFISTHGSPSHADVGGLNYLVMHNTNPDSLYATGLPLQELASAVRQRVHAKRVVLIVDACHSGAADTASKGIKRVGNIDSKSLSLGTGQLVICSSEPNQISWESKRYENGVFTHHLLESLRAGSGKAKLGQAFERMKESVLEEVLMDRKEVQQPVLKSKWKGEELILSVPPAKPRSIPPEFKE